MLLIIEIILTIVAWNKGWKWLSLLPVGIAILLGFGIGFCGGTIESNPEVIFIDILAIIVLIIMSLKTPKNNEIKNV
jgi:hypothetical protein